MDVMGRRGAETHGVTSSRLQHERGPGSVPASSAVPVAPPDLLGRVLAAADCGDGLDKDELGALEQARERLRRHGEDAQIVARLADDGFTGPYFETIQAELVAYAFPVMMSWIRRGLIFQLCASRGRPVTAPDHVRRRLAEVHDERLELANETIAAALALFLRIALREGRWSAERGASLKTYLAGACINAYPNVFRRWLGEQDHLALAAGQNAAIEVRGNPLFPTIDIDPANAVVSELAVLEELKELDPDLREIAVRVAFRADTRVEAAEAIGVSDRSVEGKLYRLRKHRQSRTRSREGGTA